MQVGRLPRLLDGGGVMWFLGRDTRTGQLLEVPETSALMSFEELSPDFSVWCTYYTDEGLRPLIVPRRHLERLPELSEVRLPE